MQAFKIISMMALVVIIFIPKKATKQYQAKQKVEAIKLTPSEQFFLGKDYPELAPDVTAYKSVVNTESQKKYTQKTNSTLWQLEGPTNIGGRITAIAIHPTSLNTILIGTPNGGIFKTTNDGTSWQPVFDNESTLAIGDIQYAPSNSSIVYAGTGDPALGGYPFIGNGIYKSIDGGNSWINSGLNATGVISKIAVHPTNPNILYAAAMGIPMVRTNDRGIYKSIDGGATWTQIKFIDNETGFSNIIINPSNPQILYASSWRRIRNNQESIISGYTSRLYKSIDGGSTWTMLTNGLPNIDLSKWNMCMSKQNPNKLYVSLTDSSLQFNNAFVTTNGGVSFTQISGSGLVNPYATQGWYFGDLTINPYNDNDMLMGGVDIWRTSDGGNSFNMAAPNWWTYTVHGDHHDVAWINTNTFYLCTDGGLYKTIDGGNTYFHYDNLPISQLYRVSPNPLIPYDYWAGAQDNGTINGNASSINSWNRVFGGDGFQQRFNPTNALELYTETQNGNIVTSDDGGFNWMTGDFNIDPLDRRHWDMPYVMSSFDSNTLYTGTQKVYKNTNGVYAFWDSISNDLTDGNIFGARFHTISAIDHSTLNAQNLLVGTTDANVWYTNNDGTTWNNITGSLPNRYVSSVKWSPNVANNMYVTHTGYKSNEYIPHIHKSTNNGSTWTDISSNLPQFAINDLVIYPGNENQLFVATDGGVYYTLNAGTSWQRLGTNMPIIPVYDIELEASTNKLIAGTFARSVQSMDLNSVTGIVIATKKEQHNLMAFPMPINNELNLKLDKAMENATIIIFDLMGKLVYKNSMDVETNKVLTIPLNISNGEYILNLFNGKESYTKKIVKL